MANELSQIRIPNGTVYDIKDATARTSISELDIPAQISKLYTGTCSTAAGTTAKVVTLDDSTDFSLKAGVRVAVTFQYGNSATTPTLNVNSTGAKTIAIPSSATAYSTGNGTTYNTWGAYETVLFTYTGTYWTHTTTGRLGYLAYNGLSSRVPTSRTVNGKALSADITLDASDVGATTTSEVNSLINTAIGDINSFDVEVVTTLPTSNIKEHTIYFVQKTGSTGDVYDEYMYINNKWEHIGSTDVDLSGYVPTTRKVNNKALSSDITLTASDVGALPSTTSIPSKTSDLTNDSGFLTSYTETDPTVPSWAKASTKPSYTASEVGAVPTTRTVNGKELSSNITLSASDVGALPSTTAIPSATSTTPKMDGTAAVGSETTFAKGDHVHPTDTSRQATITGAATTITSSNLTASRAVVSNASGKVAVSTVTSTELGYLSGTTSAIQTQINGKQTKPTTTASTLLASGWSSGVYSFTSTYPTANYDIMIEPDGYSLTSAQYEAWSKAQIVGNSNANTVKALGTVPTVDIPIQIYAIPK